MLTLLVAVLVALPANLKIDEKPSKLPPGLWTAGKLMAVATYDDNEGSHAVYIEQATKRGDLELRAFGYVKAAGWSKQWQATDFVRDCELDKVLDYRPGSLRVTDLDDDGIAEVTFAYELTCAGDVSPHTRKLLMYEGTAKYALRGETLVDIGNGEKAGGSYELDPALKNGPAVFSDHLKARWLELNGK